ncbi:MAG: hypothetical protein ACI915_003506 [Gammaproteobacteria bacterium]
MLTSVNRDDPPDGGAAHYAAAIRAIKLRTPPVAVEASTPDFEGVLRDVEQVVDPKRFGDLHCDPTTAEAQVASLHLNDSAYELW